MFLIMISVYNMVHHISILLDEKHFWKLFPDGTFWKLSPDIDQGFSTIFLRNIWKINF